LFLIFLRKEFHNLDKVPITMPTLTLLAGTSPYSQKGWGERKQKEADKRLLLIELTGVLFLKGMDHPLTPTDSKPMVEKETLDPKIGLLSTKLIQSNNKETTMRRVPLTIIISQKLSIKI
jgi:hypothetical protein